MPISKFITYDIGNLQYRIPVIEVPYLRYRRSPDATYDIEGLYDIVELLYRSFEHDIVVPYDIGTYDIVGHYDIAGGKVPDPYPPACS